MSEVRDSMIQNEKGKIVEEGLESARGSINTFSFLYILDFKLLESC